MATSEHPFAPGEQPSRQQMVDYVRGRTSEEQKHRIERFAEADPLFRAALDGLTEPGSLEAMEELVSNGPGHRGRSKVPFIAGVVVVAVLGALWWMKRAGTTGAEATPPASEAHIDVDPAPLSPEARKAFDAEVASAHPLPSSMISASFEEEHFKGRTKDVQRVERDAAPDRMKSRGGEIDRSVPPGRLTNPDHSSRQLIFLHDMKLVDPSELYPAQEPLVDTAALEARFERKGEHAEELRTGTPYLEFMEQAMGKYAAQDRKGCLEQLFVLLAEKPEDVNALFYAGLCSYDLGLFQRAVSYFEKVRQGSINTFDEEAEWYQALAQEQLAGAVAAQPLFMRIAQRGGFYAARADLKLQE